MVKERGNTWEQLVPEIARQLAARIEAGDAARDAFQRALTRATLIAPKLTIQGGTSDILRGIIARHRGLR